MHRFLEKLFVGRRLDPDVEAYFLREYAKHIPVATIPIIFACIILILFDYKQYQGALAWPWLAVVTLVQLLRNGTAQSSLSHPEKYKPVFLFFDYSTSILFVAYLFLFGGENYTETEVVFKSFYIYTIGVFQLEVLRFSLLRLLVHSTIFCGGLILNLTLFTFFPIELKVAYSSIIIFGFIMLIYFGRSSHLIALETFDLLSQNQKLITKMDDMLILDELTKQYNRRYFNAQLSKYIELHKTSQQQFSVAILDIDFFKKINDTYGHDIGDEALINVSQFVREQVRNTDVFARYGGEEFVLIFPMTNLSISEKVLEKIRQSFERHQFKIGEYSLLITVSIGATEVEASDTEESILKRADKALYQAKQDGRNRVIAI